MKAPQANLLNAAVLIIMGLWGYFETASYTAFIPVAFGVALLLCANGVKTENKVIAHIAVVLTLLILLAMLGMRLPKAIDTGGISLVRTIAPIVTGILAMVAFIMSFKAARLAREAAEQ
ncbi:MAG: putative membrane-anchored protein [Saprospiraceae bacterium]|jgi:uncharacterized membrane-anchored protein